VLDPRKASLQAASLLILFPALAACPLDPAPGDAVLPDDDSAGDDDGAGDDDDASSAADRWGAVWLLDARSDSVAGQDGPISVFAEASFRSEAQPADFPDVSGPDELPLPGVSLNPRFGATAPALEECQSISSDDDRAPLPDSEQVGASVQLVPDHGSGDPISLLLETVRYSYSGDGPVGADALDVTWAGEAGWDGATLAEALRAPERPSGILPTPGTLGDLQHLQLSWDPGDAGDTVEFGVLRFAALINEEDWQGLRCRASDDGSLSVDASELAAAGSGQLFLWVARAVWDEAGGEAGAPPVDAGFIRSVAWRMSAG
jgi:hypothetical protein